MLTSRSSWLKMPPSATPGPSSAPRNSIGTVAWIVCVHAHAQQIDVDRLAAHRVALDVLDQHVRGRALDRHLDHLGGVRERVAQDAARRP